MLVMMAQVLQRGFVHTARPPLYLDPQAPIPARAADLLGRMSLEEKAGQLSVVYDGAAVDGYATRNMSFGVSSMLSMVPYTWPQADGNMAMPPSLCQKGATIWI